MKRFSTILFLAALLMPFATHAQSQSENTAEKQGRTVIESITNGSDGDIIITVPDDLLDLIFTAPAIKKKETPSLHPGVNRMSGFRIQVFSDGRNPHSLEARAKARGNAIVARFPKYRGQVYAYSSSPNWYTRVGNFRTAQEANAALSELKRAFPQFASEMRAVKSMIVIVK